MTLYLGAANVSTTLASGITSGQTSIVLASSANLPASITAGYVLPLGISHPGTAGVFEIVYVTAISGTTLTVTRGEEGTTAQAWAAGDLVFSEVTADMLQNAFAGSSDKTFLAAPGTTGNEVVTYQQVVNAAPLLATGNAGGTTSYALTSGSFVAPSNGNLALIGVATASAGAAEALALTASLAGIVAHSPGGSTGANAIGYLPMTAGQSTTITASFTSSASVNVQICIIGIFVPAP